jgi:SWI/SNF-related matrix-associated actin-dependent regulator of chromatin subfamily A-like protein 1
VNNGDVKPSLMPHQEKGVKFLRERTAAALFDEQGLGKTKQLIEAVSEDIAAGGLDGALIICPNMIKSTWAEEVERHSNHRYAVFGSGRQARREAFRSLRAAFYIINYEAVAAELPSLQALMRFKRIALVLDESHRIKTPGAKVTRAVHQLRTEAVKRFIMSGTPVANTPDDLWSQLFFLDDGAALGSTFDAFQARYRATGGGYIRADELRERVAAISLRREKVGTVTLPPKIVSRVPVTLSGSQLSRYTMMRDELALLVRTMTGEEVLAEADNILSRLVRLAQLASNPALIDASYDGIPAKFVVLDELLPAYLADSSRKVIIWTSFVDNIQPLIDRYQQHSPVSLYGEMDGPSRERAIAAFKRDPATRVLVANPAAAREGLTLAVANVAIYLDRTFNLVDFLQSQDRIHRLTQERPCEIVVLVAEDTIDEFVDFSLAQKHRLARYTQSDTDSISVADLALRKPDLLRALLSPKAN